MRHKILLSEQDIKPGTKFKTDVLSNVYIGGRKRLGWLKGEIMAVNGTYCYARMFSRKHHITIYHTILSSDLYKVK